MSEIDLAPLGPAIERFAPMGRSGLLPALQAAQAIYGWLPESVAVEVAGGLQVPLADVHGVIEFYSLFYNQPVGRKFIRVCTDVVCALRGADSVLDHLCQRHGTEPNGTTRDSALTIEASPCLGLCDQAPAALVDELAETSISSDLRAYELGRPPSRVGGSIRMLTANCGQGSTTLDKYGEYAAYGKAL